MSVSANRVWRQLPNEIRVAVCQTFWAESKGAERQFLIASLAKANKLREVFVRKSPIERLVNWTAATKSLPDAIVDDLLKKYLLHEHRAVIISFLDLLNVPHSEGMIEENFDYASLTNERVRGCPWFACLRRSHWLRTLPEVPRASRWTLGWD